jgi:TonB family protein
MNQRWTAPAGQRCEVFLGKDPLPPVDSFLDSAALARDVIRFAPAVVVASVNLVTPDTAILRTNGPVSDSVAIVETTLTDSLSAAMLRLLGGSLREHAQAWLLLRLDIGGSVQFRTDYSMGCMPSQVDRRELQRAMQSLADRGYRGRARLRLVVARDGVPHDVTIAESSGNAALDRELVALAESSSWHPGLLNRVPVRLGLFLPLAIH